MRRSVSSGVSLRILHCVPSVYGMALCCWKSSKHAPLARCFVTHPLMGSSICATIGTCFPPLPIPLIRVGLMRSLTTVPCLQSLHENRRLSICSDEYPSVDPLGRYDDNVRGSTFELKSTSPICSGVAPRHPTTNTRFLC